MYCLKTRVPRVPLFPTVHFWKYADVFAIQNIWWKIYHKVKY